MWLLVKAKAVCMYPKVPINHQMTPVTNADSMHLRFSLYYFGARLLQSGGTIIIHTIRAWLLTANSLLSGTFSPTPS